MSEEPPIQDPASQKVDRRKIANQFWERIRKLDESRFVPHFQTGSTFVRQANEGCERSTGWVFAIYCRMWIMAATHTLVQICMRRRCLTWSARSVRRKE